MYKALLINDGHSIKGHDYIELHGRLSTDLQNTIERNYKKWRSKTVSGEIKFINDISIIRDLFVKWRYLFERTEQIGTFTIHIFLSLSDAILNACIDTNPKWKQYIKLIYK